jgi:pantetheine-phosphate adenylyltransferase
MERKQIMKTRKAVYAASLDPITNGHINVIERMAPLYDELVVVVAVDPRKSYTFTPEERVAMAKAAVAHIPNVTVDVCTGRYVVKHANDLGAQTIVRGLRNFKDLEDEQTLAEENRRICPHVETVWVPCLPHLMHVSSSMVKSHVGADPDWEEQVARSVPAAVVAKLKEKSLLGKARKHWASLMVSLGNPKGSNKVLEDLLASYGESHRAYHTLEHVMNMLDELEKVKSLLVNKEAVEMAVWYHDVVYEPDTKNHPKIASNEARSAYRARLDMEKLGLSESLWMKVGELIMATAHKGQVTDPDAQFIADLDLAILGKPEKEFATYETGVREEYSFVPEEEFRAGRSRILRSFMDRPSVYYTKVFRDRYEDTARKNLARSIDRLSRLGK